MLKIKAKFCLCSFFSMVFVNYCDSFTSWRKMTSWEWGILLEVVWIFSMWLFWKLMWKIPDTWSGVLKEAVFPQQWQRQWYFYNDMSFLIIINFVIFWLNNKWYLFWYVSLMIFYFTLSFDKEPLSESDNSCVDAFFLFSRHRAQNIFSVPVPHIL